MEAVKRRLCESYFRVLNNAPELREEIKQFNRGGQKSRYNDQGAERRKRGGRSVFIFEYVKSGRELAGHLL